MAKKHFFWLRYPDAHSRAGDAVMKRIEVVPNKSIGQYWHELHLWGMRTHCRVIRLRDQAPVRSYYVPQSGDVLQMTRTGPV